MFHLLLEKTLCHKIQSVSQYLTDSLTIPSTVVDAEGAKIPNAAPNSEGIPFRYCLDREDFWKFVNHIVMDLFVLNFM